VEVLGLGLAPIASKLEEIEVEGGRRIEVVEGSCRKIGPFFDELDGVGGGSSRSFPFLPD
jgi:hypothetical protein